MKAAHDGGGNIAGVEPFYTPNRNVPRPAPTAREQLFAFYRERDHTRWSCELIDHGPHGVEAKFFRNEAFSFSRRFDPFLDFTRPPRELAVCWAEQLRRALAR